MDTLNLPAKIESLEVFRQFVLHRVEILDLPPEALMKLELVLEELLTNVIHYAYPQGEGEMTLGCAVEDDCNVRVTIMDWGNPFDPLASKDPDLARNLDERQVGGLGIFLVRKMTDELHYERRGDCNVLTFSLRFPKSSGPAIDPL